MARVLVVDPLLLTSEFEIHPGWAGSDHEVVIPGGFDFEALSHHLPGVEAILTAHYPVTAEMMDLAPHLRLIAKPGAGVDNIDVAAAASRGVTVTNVTGVRGRSVAEHALFMMLYLARHGWLRDDPGWGSATSVQLGGRTLGILGLGAIGSHLSRFGQGLGMEVVAHTRSPDPDRSPGVTFTERDDLLARADFVVIALPLTPETRHLINAETLSLMKDDAYLINVARGPIVATEELLDVMSSGRLSGAGLDVTDPEPLPAGHGLRLLPNVLISPHNAGRTSESQQEALLRMHQNVALVLGGEAPIDPVIP